MNGIHIVAEVAQGYEGKQEQALLLLRAASAATADGVKFQLVYADELCTTDYRHYALFKSLEMPDSAWRALRAEAASRQLGFYLDVFGERSLRLAEQLGVTGLKVHSTDMSNVALLEQVARSTVSLVILSAGGCYRDELSRAVVILNGKSLVLMHGFQGYPTSIDANQLARLLALAKTHRAPSISLGFADHVPSDDPLRFTLPALALGCGATYLEKHLTLGVTLRLEDHEAALNPDEFALFCRQMRQCHLALGAASETQDFGMTEAERKYRVAMHKQVVARRPLAAGTVLTADDLALKRTPADDAFHDLDALIGKRLRARVEPDSAITPGVLES